MTCKELVDLVTDYFDGAMPALERMRFEEHAGACPECMDHLDQMKITVRVTGRLRESDISDAARADLMARFRDWSRSGRAPG